MTGKQLWEQYQHYTRDITEHARTLGFAGAALCWVFKTEQFTFPGLIYAALLAFVSYFILDILHHLIGALVVKIYTERQEAKLWKEKQSIDGEIDKPRWVDRPAFIFFILKCVALLTGFAFVSIHLVSKMSTHNISPK